MPASEAGMGAVQAEVFSKRVSIERVSIWTAGRGGAVTCARCA